MESNQRLFFKGKWYTMTPTLHTELGACRVDYLRSCMSSLTPKDLYGILDSGMNIRCQQEVVLLVGEYGIFDKVLADLEATKYRGSSERTR